MNSKDFNLAATRLAGLDWIRGAAAFWVLFHHLDVTLQKEKYFSLPPLSLLTSVGYHGVDLFFLLSGFVMARTCRGPAETSWRPAKAFLARRLLRIFPAYLTVFIPLFIAATWFGVGAGDGASTGSTFFVKNLFLLPRDDLTTFIPVVAWTLSHELMFYGIFLTSFFSWRLFMGALSAWAAISVGLYLSGTNIPGWAMQTSWMNAYFLIGVLCAQIKLEINPRKLKLLLSVALLSLAAAIQLEAQQYSQGTAGFYITQLTYSISFSILVFSLGQIQAPTLTPLTKVADYYGRISYGIYLLHYPIIVVIFMVAKKINLDRVYVAPASIALAIAITTIAADLLYRLIERPAINYGRTLFRKKTH